MSEDEIRRYLSRPSKTPVPKDRLRPVAPPRRMPPRRRSEAPESFKDFSATHLLCPRCKQAMPVRERLLLILPDGNLFDYSCTVCGTSCGTRKAGN